MTAITHSKVSAKSDGADATLVRPSDWNDDHVVDIDAADVDITDTGGYFTATDVEGALQELGDRSAVTTFIGVSVRASANQSVNNANMLFDTEDYDTDGFHSISSNTDRLTVPAGMAGKYAVFASTGITTGNIYDVRFFVNGSQQRIFAQESNPTNNSAIRSISGIVDLAVGDYVTVNVNTAGSARTMYGESGGFASQFSMYKLGSGSAGDAIGCIAVRTTDQTGIVTATDTVVLLTGTDLYDSDGFHDPAGGNPSRVTIPAGLGGVYSLNGYVVGDGNSSGSRRLQFMKNGALLPGGTDATAAAAGGIGFDQQTTSMTVALVAGDYIELSYQQTSGGNRTLSGSVVPLMFSVMRQDSGGSGGSIDVTDGTTTVSPVGVLEFDPASFSVIDQGGDSALIEFIGSAGGATAAKGEALCTADTSIDSSGFTDVSGLSVSLEAGTYVILWKVLMTFGSASRSAYAKLWNGTILYDEWEDTADNSSFRYSGGGFATITLATTTTVKVSVKGEVSGTVKRDGGSSTDHHPTKISWVRVGSGGRGNAAGAKVYNNTTQLASNSSATTLTYNSEDFDTDGFHSTSSNTSRLTVPAGLGGKYLVTARTFTPFATTNSKYIQLHKNGDATPFQREGYGASAVVDTVFIYAVMDLVAGDYIETTIVHDNGTNQNVGHASARRVQSEMSIMRFDSGSNGGVTTVECTAQCYIYAQTATTNYSDGTSQWSGGASGAYSTKNLMQFSLSGVGSVKKAWFQWTFLNGNNCIALNEGAGTVLYVVRNVRADINYSQATWNAYKTGSNWGTAGANGSSDRSLVNVGITKNFYSGSMIALTGAIVQTESVDITALVQDAIADGATTLDIAFYANATGGQNQFQIAGIGHTTAAYRPKLLWE